MNAVLRLSGAGKRDPLIEEWLIKTDALTADTSQTYFRELLRVCAHSDKSARPELQEAERAILQK
jgi:hypothetical protein